MTPYRKRSLAFGLLYASEGAPIGFIWWAMPTQLRLAGVEPSVIAVIVGLLVVPWIFKFLWAPLIDYAQSRFGGFQFWVILAQIFMGLTLLPLVHLDLQEQFQLVVVCLFAHAFFAATQDVAIDGWLVKVTPVHERGKITGWMQAGMLIGRWLFGAGLLLVSDQIDFHVTIYALVAWIWFMLLVVVVTLYFPRGFEYLRGEANFGVIGRNLKRALTSSVTWLGIAIALTAGAGFEAVGAIAGPFFVDRGYSGPLVGYYYTAAVPAMMLGAVLGGYLADRVGHRITVMVAVVAIFAIISSVSAAAMLDLAEAFVVTPMVVLYAGIGLLTVSSYALFMDLTNPKIAGTQFSTYMGATNGCESWAAIAIGGLLTFLPYSQAFFFIALASLVSLFFLIKVKGRFEDSGPKHFKRPVPPA
ncbi:MAG: MFS transporter [Puniceicoccaceae bacterium]|nr:MAG: MFS transporter [Puniceicoccaceae bacterium]